ncbi:hypothetical protein VTN77DRAFT_5795 [Rasamsonia byssochlamydoides]|uniref:uncharacterized protein n=1 Tax=Rasamsonia byssochlamydoides TaxID=89139 RepID=UPI0037424200
MRRLFSRAGSFSFLLSLFFFPLLSRESQSHEYEYAGQNGMIYNLIYLLTVSLALFHIHKHASHAVFWVSGSMVWFLAATVDFGIGIELNRMNESDERVSRTVQAQVCLVWFSFIFLLEIIFSFLFSLFFSFLFISFFHFFFFFFFSYFIFVLF